MAEKRIREEISTTPTLEILTPEQPTPQTNQYDSVLQKLQELEEQNKILTKKIAEANWDISEKVKESKRKYGYNMDWSRKSDELFKYWYRTLIDDRKEKVVTKSETIGRPVNVRNNNTGKWHNEHNVEITFHDGTKAEMDVLDYINQSVKIEDYVQDSDIKVIDGIKNYTFRTEKFWTFTIPQNFIN